MRSANWFFQQTIIFAICTCAVDQQTIIFAVCTCAVDDDVPQVRIADCEGPMVEPPQMPCAKTLLVHAIMLATCCTRLLCSAWGRTTCSQCSPSLGAETYACPACSLAKAIELDDQLYVPSRTYCPRTWACHGPLPATHRPQLCNPSKSVCTAIVERV